MTDLCNTGPSKVTNVSLAVFEATSLNVTWAIPQSDMPITWYEVQYRTDEAQSWSSTPHLSGLPPPSSTVVNGMHSGFDYEVRVRAMSDVGAGEWSEEQTQRIGSMFIHCNLHVSILYIYTMAVSANSYVCIG